MGATFWVKKDALGPLSLCPQQAGEPGEWTQSGLGGQGLSSGHTLTVGLKVEL